MPKEKHTRTQNQINNIFKKKQKKNFFPEKVRVCMFVSSSYGRMNFPTLGTYHTYPESTNGDRVECTIHVQKV